MAVVDKRLYKGTLGDTSATLYPVPAGKFVIVKAVTLCNKTATAATVTISFAGLEVIYQYAVAARDTITIPFMDQILEASEEITGLAGTASAINVYISGKEVTV